MKFQIEIDCTPVEARQFLGLPDVAPMQERLMQKLEDQITEVLGAQDPEALMKSWLPVGMAGFEQMQKAFWDNFTSGGSKK